MQKHLTFFLALFIGFSSLAQVNLDSLWNVWNDKTQADTSRLKAMHDIAWVSYLDSQPDSAFYFAGLEYDFAESVNNKQWIGNALTTQGASYSFKGDYTKAIDYLTKSLKIHKELGNKKDIARALSNIGVIYSYQGSNDKALDYYTRSLKIKEEIGDKQGIAHCLNNIGAIYQKQSKTKKAIKYYKKVINIIDENISPKIASKTYTEIGMLLKISNNNKSAIEYFHKSLILREQIKWNDGIGWNLKDIGSAYKDIQEFDSAVYYVNKGIDFFRKTNNNNEIAYSLLTLGKIYLNLKKFIKAKQYIDESKKIFNELDDKKGIIESNLSLAKILISNKNYKEALPFLIEGENYFKDNLPNLVKINKTLYKVNKNLGKNIKALEYLEKYNLLEDSLHRDDLNKTLIKMKYDTQYRIDSIEFVKAKETEQIQHIADMKHEDNKRKILIAGIGFLILLGGLGFLAFFQKKKDNRIIQAKKQEVDIAYEKLEDKNNDILASINYAKRIQSALLPTDLAVKESFKESFILYLPKDIVAGDFYWLEKTKDTTLFAVADCTGHGVSGAMVSVICNNGLNRSVREHNITQPSKILDKTREIVIQEFAKSNEDIQDGMDIALCSINGDKLNYSGAHNPLIVIRDKQVIQIKADRQPIGAYEQPEDFTNHSLDIQKGDMIYIFTDGFVDQFGGEKRKKYKLKNLLVLLTNISTKTLSEQNSILKQEFESWKGTEDQIDDVCVMGVRV